MYTTEEATAEVHVEEREVEAEAEEGVKEKLKVEPEPGIEVEGAKAPEVDAARVVSTSKVLATDLPVSP